MDFDPIIALLPDTLLDTRLPDPTMLKYYEDITNRTFWLNDEVNSDLVYELTHYIIKFNREDKDIDPIDRKPIYLMFDSPGGNIDAYASICSIIELSKTPIIGVAIGMVASAASLIYLTCHLRLALKSSYFILHKGSATLNGDFDNIMNSIDDYKKEVNKMVDLIISHSNYSRQEVEEHIGKDWYVRMEEAEKKGLVDEIITNINMVL
ncbi:MAG: ATP-dependent Clp protease proteolytic subunit [Bacillota bacterium]|nr:ATP-dependent Clp protease proteolytic subunit [Bacillota bacterium]